MKSVRFQRYSSGSIFKVALSPLMPWEPRRKSRVKSNLLRQITSSLLKPTIPPCINRWMVGCKRLVSTALYLHLVNTRLKPDITALKFAKSGLSQLIYFRRSIRQTNGLEYRRLWWWNAPVIYGIKPPTKLSSTSAVCRLPVRELRPQSGQHWGIENSLHWTLDVTNAYDDCRVRSLHAPHNLALLRRFALNALNP